MESVLSFEDNEISCGHQMAGSNSLAHHFEEVISRPVRALDVDLPGKPGQHPGPLGLTRMGLTPKQMATLPGFKDLVCKQFYS